MSFNSCMMVNYISEHSFKSAKWDLKQKLQTKLCLSCVNIRPNCRALLHEFFCEVNSYQSKVITTLPRRRKPKSPWVRQGNPFPRTPAVLHQLGCHCSSCDLDGKRGAVLQLWAGKMCPLNPSPALSASTKQPAWQKHCHFINQQAPAACEAQCEKRHRENRWEAALVCYMHWNYL